MLGILTMVLAWLVGMVVPFPIMQAMLAISILSLATLTLGIPTLAYPMLAIPTPLLLLPRLILRSLRCQLYHMLQLRQYHIPILQQL